MEPLTLVTGALIAAGGYVIGRLTSKKQVREALGAKQQARKEALNASQSKNPQPLCGCGHHLVFHDQETKRCQTQVVIPGRWTGSQNSSYRQCMCQGYRGPMPIDEYYAPDYMQGSDS